MLQSDAQHVLSQMPKRPIFRRKLPERVWDGKESSRLIVQVALLRWEAFLVEACPIPLSIPRKIKECAGQSTYQ